MILFIFIAAFALFFPINWYYYEGDHIRIIKAVFISIYKTITMFTGSGDFDSIIDATAGLGEFIRDFYRIIFAVVFFIAPILTFGFVMLFFKNTRARVKYLFSFRKNVYVFSELNAKSVILAEDIKKVDKNSAIIFTGVDKNNESEWYERASDLKSIIFSFDITSLKFKKTRKNKKLRIFLFTEDDETNLSQFEEVYKKVKDLDNAEIRYLAMTSQSGLAISKNKERKVKIYRINYNSFFIYRYLYEKGTAIFDNTVAERDGKKVISIIIVGVGVIGKLLLKAYVWYAQMYGYYLKINAFDSDGLIEEKLAHECPELLDPRFNKQEIFGDAQYDITIHSGVSAGTREFDEELKKIDDASFVFVSMNGDEKNISAAIDLRMQFERIGLHPVINAVVNSDKEEYFKNATNFKGERFDVSFIGDYKDLYSYKSIIANDLEVDALNRHLRFMSEESFWAYEYNYCSSCAAAIHAKAKVHCGIVGADGTEGELTPSELEDIARLEHMRWNAWMRGEGYVYSGSPDPNSRKDLAKMHHDLIPYGALNEGDKDKDVKIVTKN
ncbi:MAG: hypothetical protein J6Y44_01360 [Clostridia bacterium]|nr:hypothetical protein [Clostridia bacterium]